MKQAEMPWRAEGLAWFIISLWVNLENEGVRIFDKVCIETRGL